MLYKEDYEDLRKKVQRFDLTGAVSMSLQEGVKLMRELVLLHDAALSHATQDDPCEACKSGVVTIRVPEFTAVLIENEWMNRKACTVVLRKGFCPGCGKKLKGE